ncbi:hypothetical protein AAMO2058_000006800 [Amorphochlora amoebiformis]
MEGFLLKKSSGIISKWQRRYFKLEDGEFMYWKQDDKGRKGSITSMDVNDIKMVQKTKEGFSITFKYGKTSMFKPPPISSPKVYNQNWLMAFRDFAHLTVVGLEAEPRMRETKSERSSRAGWGTAAAEDQEKGPIIVHINEEEVNPGDNEPTGQDTSMVTERGTRQLAPRLSGIPEEMTEGKNHAYGHVLEVEFRPQMSVGLDYRNQVVHKVWEDTQAWDAGVEVGYSIHLVNGQLSPGDDEDLQGLLVMLVRGTEKFTITFHKLSPQELQERGFKIRRYFSTPTEDIKEEPEKTPMEGFSSSVKKHGDGMEGWKEGAEEQKHLEETAGETKKAKVAEKEPEKIPEKETQSEASLDFEATQEEFNTGTAEGDLDQMERMLEASLNQVAKKRSEREVETQDADPSLEIVLSMLGGGGDDDDEFDLGLSSDEDEDGDKFSLDVVDEDPDQPQLAPEENQKEGEKSQETDFKYKNLSKGDMDLPASRLSLTSKSLGLDEDEHESDGKQHMSQKEAEKKEESLLADEQPKRSSVGLVESEVITATPTVKSVKEEIWTSKSEPDHQIIVAREGGESTELKKSVDAQESTAANEGTASHELTDANETVDIKESTIAKEIADSREPICAEAAKESKSIGEKESIDANELIASKKTTDPENSIDNPEEGKLRHEISSIKEKIHAADKTINILKKEWQKQARSNKLEFVRLKKMIAHKKKNKSKTIAEKDRVLALLVSSWKGCQAKMKLLRDRAMATRNKKKSSHI